MKKLIILFILLFSTRAFANTVCYTQNSLNQLIKELDKVPNNMWKRDWSGALKLNIGKKEINIDNVGFLKINETYIDLNVTQRTNILKIYNKIYCLYYNKIKIEEILNLLLNASWIKGKESYVKTKHFK